MRSFRREAADILKNTPAVVPPTAMASHAADDHDDTENSQEQSSSMASSPRQFAPITRTESERAEELARSRHGYTYGLPATHFGTVHGISVLTGRQAP